MKRNDITYYSNEKVEFYYFNFDRWIKMNKTDLLNKKSSKFQIKSIWSIYFDQTIWIHLKKLADTYSLWRTKLDRGLINWNQIL